MVETTMIKALKKLEELNDYNEILVITNAGEPLLIENAIEDIQRNAEDPEEVFDLIVSNETIRELDENGYIKTGEPLYAVIHEDDDNHRGMSDSDWKELFHTDFELTNKNVETWEKAQFWESDPMQNNQSLCRIILYVNWEKKTVTVETQMKTNSTDGEVWNGLASELKLPEDTDFEEFPKFFNEEVKPLLQKIGSGYESSWNGSNWKGRLTEEAHGIGWELQQLLDGANVPTHDMVYYFSLRDSYECGGMAQLKDNLKSEGVDILTADLSDKEIMEKAVNAVTWDEGSDYKLIDVDVEEELREIQEELQEEEEENSE